MHIIWHYANNARVSKRLATHSIQRSGGDDSSAVEGTGVPVWWLRAFVLNKKPRSQKMRAGAASSPAATVTVETDGSWRNSMIVVGSFFLPVDTKH